MYLSSDVMISDETSRIVHIKTSPVVVKVIPLNKGEINKAGTGHFMQVRSVLECPLKP